jgi:hypothetical protein
MTNAFFVPTGQFGASTSNCLAYEAGAEALPLWKREDKGRDLHPSGPRAGPPGTTGPAMKLVDPLAGCPTFALRLG